MTMTRQDTVAREYLRVSYDRSGRERSVTEQHDDNARHADGRGVRLGAPYREERAVSASRYSQRTRDAFVELLDDLKADRFGASELWLWESSRGSRKVGEWVELIDLAEKRDIVFYVTSHSRSYDPSDARDRRSLLEDAVDSEYESAKISARAKRSAAANAADGKPHGHCPFGYRRVYDPRTGALVGQDVYEPEAKIVRELYDRLRQGHSLRSIARDFAAKGYASRTGTAFSAQTLRDMAMRPAYVGLRSHSVADKRKRHSLDGATKGTWQALVSEETYYAVRRTLTRPERQVSRPGRAIHLLSHIGRCDPCGAPLSVTNRFGRRLYQCHIKGCVKVDADELDQVAEAVMLGWLARDDVYDAFATPDTAEALATVRAELSRERLSLTETESATPADIHEARALGRLAQAQSERVRELEDRERELSTPSVLRDLIAPGEDVAERWKAAPISTKREVARMLLSPDLLGELRVTRRPNTGCVRVQAAERVEWRRRSAHGEQ